MPTLRPILAILALAPLVAFAPAMARDTAPCALQEFIPGTQLVAAAPGEYVKVRFRVDARLSDTFWGEVALHWATSGTVPPAYYGFAAERAMVATFFETASGASLGGDGALSMFPYGVQVSAGTEVLRLEEQDEGGCGAAAAGTPLTLEPGEYVAIAFGATDTNGATGAVLPNAVTVVGVERGLVTTVTEAAMACDAKLVATALGVASETLVNCKQAIHVEGKAYRAVLVSHFPDATHQARWIDPAGQVGPNIVFYTIARGAPGTWTLDVPKYVTPVGHPFYVPVGGPVPSSESGIFGAVADVD